MAYYRISARNSASVLGLEEPLTAEAAYHKIVELRDAGYDHITLINIETGEQIADVQRLLLKKPDA